MRTTDAMETRLDLHLFDGEGGGGAAAGAGAAEDAGDAQNDAAIPSATGGKGTIRLRAWYTENNPPRRRRAKVRKRESMRPKRP